jgi:hypothetical protein
VCVWGRAGWRAEVRYRLDEVHRFRFALALQVPGDIDDDDALIAAHQEQEFEELRSLVVEEVVPQAADDEFGKQDGDLAVGVVALDLQDVLDERHENKAVGGFERDKLRESVTGLLNRSKDITSPHGADLLDVVVCVDVYGLNLVAEFQAETKRFLGNACPAVHWDDDEGRHEIFHA